MVLGKPQTDPTLEWFLSHCHIHKYPSKSTLIHQGEKAETLYYIVKGSVAVLIKDEEGKEMILSYLNQGDFIGELGLFEEGPSSASHFRESGQPGVPRRDGPHCTDSAESGKTTGCYDSPGRYANQNYPSGNRSDCRLFS